MLERLKKIPWIGRRTPFERGIFAAAALTLALGVLTLETSRRFFARLSPSLLLAIAGIGATLYIAYIVGMSGLFRETKVRSGDRANFVGFTTSLGICGFFGIGICVVVAAHGHRPLEWMEQFGCAWAATSIFCLGVIVGALPLIAYDEIRSEHTNPDE